MRSITLLALNIYIQICAKRGKNKNFGNLVLPPFVFVTYRPIYTCILFVLCIDFHLHLRDCVDVLKLLYFVIQGNVS